MKFLPFVFLAVLAMAGCAGSGGRQSSNPVAEESRSEAARRSARIHTELGMAYLASGQLTTALDEARISLNADSDYALAYNLLGLTHMQMKETARAEEYFEQAMRLAPGDSEIRNNMGWFLCESGREIRSFDHFEAAARNPLYGTPARPLINAGHCAIRVKDYKRAEGYLAQALRLDPEAVEGNRLLGEALFQQQRYAEARLRLNQFHQRSEPTAASAWLALRIERKVGDTDAETRWITQLRRRFPDSPEYRKLTQGLFE